MAEGRYLGQYKMPGGEEQVMQHMFKIIPFWRHYCSFYSKYQTPNFTTHVHRIVLQKRAGKWGLSPLPEMGDFQAQVNL